MPRKASAASKTTVRKDPKPLPVNTGTPYFQLINENPNHSYKWVYKGAREMGVDYYRDYLGYEPVQYVEGGVRALVGSQKKNGDYIESMGHLLMCCSKEREREIAERGADGQSGQLWADEQERKMHNSKKAIAELSKRVAMRSADGTEYFEFESEKNSVASIPMGDS
jgi:hypothetical protein